MTATKESVGSGLLQRRLDAVSSNILRYFGSVPHLAREAGYAGGESLVSMGNGLLFISCELNQVEQPRQPVGEPAETVRNLSVQFQEVGREIWQFDPAKNSGLSAKVHRMELQIRNLQQMMLRQGVGR